MNGSDPPSSRTCFFSAAPAALATCSRDFARAGERDRVDARVGDELARPSSRAPGACRRRPAAAGALEDLLDGQRAAGHVGGVLEHGAVAGHQRRRGEAEDLPEGEVPGHDRQHHAERLERDVALRSVGVSPWSPETGRCSRRRSRFQAHFSISASASTMGLPISSVARVARRGFSSREQLGHLRQVRPAGLEAEAPPGALRVMGLLKDRLDQLGRMLVEACHLLLGGGIYGSYRHTETVDRSRLSGVPGPARRRCRPSAGRRSPPG